VSYALLSALCTALGGYASKIYASNETAANMVLPFLMYNLGAFLWLKALADSQQLAILGAIVSTLSLLATVLVGAFFFKEHLNPHHWVGVGMAVVSVYMLAH
jgi:multidrug transporter EmrE-like cation transporter